MTIPIDPLLATQWHLRNQQAGLLDLNVFGAWDALEGPTYNGAGVRALVIDDGFDYDHDDLSSNYLQSLDYDYDYEVSDAFGEDWDSHGTAVAGIIGAAANGLGAVGVAYGASLVGYRVYTYISDEWLVDIRDSIYDGALNAQADVANISQGIANDEYSEFGFGYNAARFDEIESSIGTAVSQGRGGLGMTIVKSAGNSRGDLYDVNADDWTNDTRQVVVGAVDQDGYVSYYSSYGSSLLVSAFGTPGEVVTTDRRGNAGYESGSYTSGFNGTSAAAPMVSGVVSLIYDAAPDLGWRDVQSILAASARHVGTDIGGGSGGAEFFTWGWNAAQTWNGGGQHYSNDYGYGLVDAWAAVRLAESWRLTGAAANTNANQTQTRLDVLNSVVTLPDGDVQGRSFSGIATGNVIVERATVEISFEADYVGDLEVYLVSPNGTQSQLLSNVDSDELYDGTWTFETQAFRGERNAGTWTARVVDSISGDAISVSDVVIRTFGANNTFDRYVFTNEYSDYDGVAGHRTAISDGNGGVDTVNAAAVSSRSNIRLDGSTGLIDGVAVSFSNMENAIGGDIGDTLVGNAEVNRLFGMRGWDTISAGAGADFAYGAWGNDLLNGGSGADTVAGGDGDDRVIDDDLLNSDAHSGSAGVDTIDYSRVTFAAGTVTLNLTTGLATTTASSARDTIAAFENARGSQGGETIRGTSGVNLLEGNGGDDRLIGEGGADVLTGGLGRDQLYGGAGFDRFVFTARTESPVGAACDVLIGYSSGVAFDNAGSTAGDLIDLTGIDANETASGNQGFLFSTAQTAGTLRCVEASGVTRVFGYVNSTAGADFQIDIQDGGVLASAYRGADFLL